MICTDGSPIYQNIGRYHPVVHRVDIHKAWEYSLTSEIEGVFGNLRTFIRRMYHHSPNVQKSSILPHKLSDLCANWVAIPHVVVGVDKRVRIYYPVHICTD